MLMKYPQLPSNFQKCTNSLKKITYLARGHVSFNSQLKLFIELEVVSLISPT